MHRRPSKVKKSGLLVRPLGERVAVSPYSVPKSMSLRQEAGGRTRSGMLEMLGTSVLGELKHMGS